ncbi:hypothetical protein Poli38472_013019 [Pythium oligandrum]|uniref:Uncharacterized protein n=1 Tax=Pythium oligandrum TaxID=41045 RepID=A0A8K1FM16_PYTOL|nr:hypothetical protein Poli38472_013019 [Pythium oligandrum]|eukprot:TMW64397.1 hypothetical protein Poli38472_013019 [Pythium oligandrum]
MLRMLRAMAVGGHGCYSEERVRAFDAYCQKTSRRRAFAVCILSPVPSLLYVIILEAAFPLAPPEEGWAANYNAWIRMYCAGIVLAHSLVSLGGRFVPDFQFPRRVVACTAIATGTIYILVCIGWAALWVYPLPFFLLLTTGPYMVIWATCFRCIVDTTCLRQVQNLRFKLLNFVKAVVWICALTLFYPAYTALCATQTGYLYVFITVLPTLLKTGMKAKLASYCRAVGQEDQISSVIQFTIEVFHSLYIINCVQLSTNAALSTLAFVLLDLGPSLLNSHKILRGARSVSPSPTKQIIPPVPTKPRLTQELGNRISRTMPGPVWRNASKITFRSAASRRVLLMCEYHLVYEFVESFIPVAYMIYLSILYHLPNRKYYPHMAALQTDADLHRMLLNISVFAVLETTSLIFFCRVVQRKLGMSGLFQLAFFLEDQCEMVQAWLFLWMPYCLFFTVKHGGVDFTLKFAWIH